MMRRFFIWLVMAVVLAQAASSAIADDWLTFEEFVEQVAVPMAQANDSDSGVNNAFSVEELSSFVRAYNENGFTLKENNSLMQSICNGLGYYEEEAIMEICRQAFGGYYATWTLEQQDWFDRQMVSIGFRSTYQSQLPDADNLTYEQAEAFAFAALKKQYGADLTPEDRSLYTLERWFDPADDEMASRAGWYFKLTPKDLMHGAYTVSFDDADPEGSVSFSAEVPDWSKPYSGEQLWDWMQKVYTWSQGDWPQSAWQTFHEMLLEAVPGKYLLTKPEMKAYQLTEYPDPDERDISEEAAIRAAREAGVNARAALDGVVLTEYEGHRYWMVSLLIMQEWPAPIDEEAGWYVVGVDSATGLAGNVRKKGLGDNEAMMYTPEAAYQKALEEARQQ